MGQTPTDPSKLLGKVDANDEGNITKAQYRRIFARIMHRPLELTKDSLVRLFKANAASSDGELTIDEARKLVLGLTSDKRINPVVIDELLAKADKNGNGKLDVKEFSAFASQSLDF
ncbi:hypothetical protein BJ742DRAFT_769805 [Cladochytrium replicatum]|nr:hypothetical protein BJ742DRAFT_769805 [Cladochytrium replicatum]